MSTWFAAALWAYSRRRIGMREHNARVRAARGVRETLYTGVDRSAVWQTPAVMDPSLFTRAAEFQRRVLEEMSDAQARELVRVPLDGPLFGQSNATGFDRRVLTVGREAIRHQRVGEYYSFGTDSDNYIGRIVAVDTDAGTITIERRPEFGPELVQQRYQRELQDRQRAQQREFRRDPLGEWAAAPLPRHVTTSLIRQWLTSISDELGRPLGADSLRVVQRCRACMMEIVTDVMWCHGVFIATPSHARELRSTLVRKLRCDYDSHQCPPVAMSTFLSDAEIEALFEATERDAVRTLERAAALRAELKRRSST